MTYHETQQQNPMHNSQFNPQQWAAFNSQAAQPYAAWSSAPLMQAIGGYGLGGYGFGQAASGQQSGQYGAQPDPGAATATTRGNRLRCLRPSAAHAEPAGCQRSGAAPAADRATDRRNAAEPAAATICRHARRPGLGSARLGSIRAG